MSDDPIVPVTNNPSPDRPERYRPSRQNTTGNIGGFVTLILLIVLIVGVVLLGWLAWQQGSQLELATSQVNALNEKVSVLEQELEVTGSSLAESDSDVVESVKLWETETRKLWDLYNQRIKRDIATNQSSIDLAKRQVTEFQNALDELQTNMLLTTRSQQDLTDKLNLLDQQIARKLADIELQVRTNKESLDAIDRSRASNNNRILELERKVRDLAASN